MATRLTDAVVRAIEPSSDGKQRLVWDADLKGFGLRVTPAGSAAFILNYRVRGSGISRRYTIGAAASWQAKNGVWRFRPGAWSAAAARNRAKALATIVDAGGDPQGELHEHRQAPTVHELTERYLGEHASVKKRASSVREDVSLLNQWVRPELGNRKVRDVMHEDIEALHRRISKATPHRANRVVALLSKMFSLAIKWRLRDDNPTRGIERNQEMQRQRFLKPEEFARLLAALAAHEDHEAANVVRLLLLTGARRGEVLGARWDQFDLTKGTWTKPAAFTKQRQEHYVPLSAAARLLLSTMRTEADAGEARAAALQVRAQAERHPKRKAALLHAASRERHRQTSPYLFPGFGDDGKPLEGIRNAWKEIISAADLAGLRLHDLRHSYASFLASAGMSLPIIGRLLGHTQSATTMRYAHLLDDPIRQATERVGAMVHAIETDSKAEVVELPGRGRQS
jgi:integrase